MEETKLIPQIFPGEKRIRFKDTWQYTEMKNKKAKRTDDGFSVRERTKTEQKRRFGQRYKELVQKYTEDGFVISAKEATVLCVPIQQVLYEKMQIEEDQGEIGAAFDAIRTASKLGRNKVELEYTRASCTADVMADILVKKPLEYSCNITNDGDNAILQVRWAGYNPLKQ